MQFKAVKKKCFSLGVLFEVIWKNADENEKHEMLETLEQGLKISNLRITFA